MDFSKLHPAWGLAFIAFVMCWLTFTLWLLAANFDATEIASILQFIAPLLAAEGWWLWRWAVRKKEPPQEES